MISERLTADMKAAMKSGDKVKLGVIRMLRAELKNARIAAGEDLTDAQEEKVLAGYAKKRKEAMEQYRQGGREDLAGKESAEYEITISYLPPRMDDAELAALVKSKIEETGASGKKDFGNVMKAVMQAAGSRADGAAVSAVLRKLLN